MKLKPKQSSTVVMRVTPATLKAIDAYRGKMGLRTNAQGAEAMVATHPDMSGEGIHRGAGKRRKQSH